MVKFKNRQLLYYYMLFLFIIGSCTYGGRGGDETDDDIGIEEIDKEKEKQKKDDGSYESDLSGNANGKDNFSDEDEEFTQFVEEAADYFSEHNSDEDVDLSGFPDLSGSWVNLTVFRGKAKPFLISECNAWAIMISKVNVTQNGSVLESQNEMCRLKVGNDTKPHIQSLIPDTYAKALPIVDKTFYLSKDEVGEVLFHQPKVWEVRACTLDDPENDPLPTKENDHRVFDPDNTGINGLKVQAKGAVNGYAEVVQKVSTILDGKVDEFGEIRGIVKWYEDQKVVWTDNVLMSNGSPTSYSSKIDESESFFVFKRIDEEFGCDWIHANSAFLFPEASELYPEQFN